MKNTNQRGNGLPGFAVKPTAVQLFCFSAATWNPHRIHYDASYTTVVEGHQDLVVQGPLLGAWLLELAQKWVSGWGEVETVSYRNIQSAFVDQEMQVLGEVLNEDESAPEAKLWIKRSSDGVIVCEGKATARRTSPAI